jgi:hypothetical protein
MGVGRATGTNQRNCGGENWQKDFIFHGMIGLISFR